ncbi:hypothetical protein H8K52_01090 [Undibacterium seohonense]|uniref:Lipoprotein n=1 Tax=Undibacterium seohonense TaxID=1344950 RepID=A0ABR6WZE1_9BURK|nr:hypothetical protein [Undibacterium seohonense]MBC3805935.1 hypothetical protein [Undibacterium seohonense]
MTQQSFTKQSIIIGVLSGALVLAIGALALFYYQSRNSSQTINQDAKLEELKVASLPSISTAFQDLFGVTELNGKAKTAPDKLTSFWFEKTITIDGNNYHAKFFSTQSLDEKGKPNDSHADGVDVDVVTYKQNLDKWEVIAKQPKIGGAGTWGSVQEAKFEILKLSSKSVALLLDGFESGQGYTHEGKSVYIFAKNNWVNAGYVATGGDNSGTCSDEPLVDEDGILLMGPCYSHKGTISVDSGSTSEYPNLLITRTGTESKEPGKSIAPAKNITYIYKNGSYIDQNEKQ